MPDIYKHYFAFLICLLILSPSSVLGEPDVDIFFRNTNQYQDVIIKEVRGVDTMILEEKTGEKGEIIKLIGLRAPEEPKKKREDTNRDQYGFPIKKEVSPLTPMEEIAFDFVKEILEGQHVRLEFDAEKVDESYTTIAYVFLLKNNTFVNAEILRQGYAHLSIRPPNTKYAQQLREAYKEARTQKKGYQGQ